VVDKGEAFLAAGHSLLDFKHTMESSPEFMDDRQIQDNENNKWGAS
jgi:hypothetical protein